MFTNHTFYLLLSLVSDVVWRYEKVRFAVLHFDTHCIMFSSQDVPNICTPFPMLKPFRMQLNKDYIYLITYCREMSV